MIDQKSVFERSYKITAQGTQMSSLIYKNGKCSFRRQESLHQEAFIHYHKLSDRIPEAF